MVLKLNAAGVALMSTIATISAQSYLDKVAFGDAASEAGHSFAGVNSAIITNTSVSPAQQGRRVLAATTNDVYGGWLTVTMNVDPVWRNYFSIKLWGSDDVSEQIGRLYLYVPMSNYVAGATNNYQIGYRHEGDYAPLSVTAWSPPLPGRFFYSTTLLPLWMTQGRTNLTLKIMAAGRYYAFGTGGPPNGNCQFPMTENSRGIFAAYTHTQPGFDPAGEVQGVRPVTTTRPSPTASILQPGGSYYNGAVSLLNNRLNRTVTTANLPPWDIQLLAHSYSITNLFTYTNPAVVAKVMAAIDCHATNYFANTNNGKGGWGGPYGWIGRAVAELKPQFESSFDVVADYGPGGMITRRSAWGQMLKTSRDDGRFNRRGLSNQGLITDEQIYLANKGMVALNDPDAIPEADAQRYLKEAIGISPWLGSDLPGGGSDAPYGTNYFQATEKGQTREFGYVGCNYGEMQFYAANFYRYTGNPVFQAQGVKMVKGRVAFRRPSMEVSGASYYRTMEGIGLLAWRGARESDGDFFTQVAYAERLGGGMGVAGVTLDPDVVGYAKHMLADNQYFTFLGSPYDNLDVFHDYLAVANAPDNGRRMPMADGQPDFAWADEDNGVVAVKKGNERLWLSTYWQAGWGSAVNGIGRFHYSTNDHDCYGTLETSPTINFSGNFFVRGNMLDLPYKTTYWPPDNPVNAYTGERLPIGASDFGAKDDSVFRGKAQFWAARYRNFLIGINRDPSRPFRLQTPAGFTSALDLISGQMVSGPVMVGPRSTVVLFLESAGNNSPVPFAPLTLNAVADRTPKVVLDWSASSGAQGYNVKRSTTKGGPYTTIANVSTTNYTDTGMSFGMTYYYMFLSPQSGSGTIRYAIKNNGAEQQINGPSVPSAGAWHHIAVTLSGATGKLYVDGVAVGTNTSMTIKPSDLGWTWGNYIGKSQFNDPYLNGSVDDFRIYNRALSATEITTLRNKALPATPTGLSATPGNTQVALSWNTASGATRYNVKRSTVSGGPYVTITNVTSTSFTDTGLTAGTCYYVVSALNVAIVSSDSAQVSATPAAPPAAPVGLTATLGNAQVALNWSASSGATNYIVKRAFASNGAFTVITNISTTSYVDSGLTNGTTYFYVVAASSEAGASSDSERASATPVAPPATPAGLAAVRGNGQVALSWNASSGASLYKLKRSTTSGSGYVTITTVSGRSIVDLGLNNGVAYYYVVSAVNDNSESGDSAQVGVTPVAVPEAGVTISVNFRGGSPNNGNPSLMAKAESAGVVVTTNWNNASGVSGTVSSLGQSDGATTVASVSWSCNNTWSTPITETYGDARMMKGYLDTTATSTTTVTVNNLPPAYTTNGYFVFVYCDGDTSNDKTGVYSIGTVTNTAVDPGGMHFSGEYARASGSAGNYVVFTNLTSSSFTLLARGSAVDGSGARGPLNAIQVVAHKPPVPDAPAAPAGLAATAGDAQVFLNWNASIGATGYSVKRSLTSGSGYVTVTNVTGTTVANTSLANGTLYYYVVFAVNAGGESADSLEAFARPVSLASPRLATGLSAGRLQLNWPATHVGWRLETQTYSLASGLGTNWVAVPGSAATNQLLIPVNIENGSVFFRLVYP
jgi:fibronectin type 3 domain-containing protein